MQLWFSCAGAVKHLSKSVWELGDGGRLDLAHDDAYAVHARVHAASVKAAWKDAATRHPMYVHVLGVPFLDPVHWVSSIGGWAS